MQGDPSMTTVKGEGLEDCVVGSDRHFLIESVDKHGHRLHPPPSTLHPTPYTLNPQPSTLNPQH